MDREQQINNFLRRACGIIQEYDLEGEARVSLNAWPNILADLGLEESSDGAAFLIDHLDKRGDGYFSYLPLLRALGAALPEERAAPAQIPSGGRVEEGYDDTAQEDDESFWANRASALQRLYNAWDCNQLSNESFNGQIQRLLGNRVDVSSEDSEFLRLTNKHRTARNLRFAALMAALRHDARSTMQRQLGRLGSGYSGSNYGDSRPMSAYGESAPSEACSETPSHAAGRPSSGTTSGRKHYQHPQTDSRVLGYSGRGEQAPSEMSGRAYTEASHHTEKLFGGSPQRQPAERAIAQRRPAPFTDDDSQPQQSSRQERRAPADAPWATNDSSQHQNSRPTSGSDFRNRQRQFPHDRTDAMSEFSEMSEADSQREVFSARNRSGHGNFLTWGNDSRSITPEKKREGRQLTVDPEQGVPRSYIGSNIFANSR